jgi:hypothetical protein
MPSHFGQRSLKKSERTVRGLHEGSAEVARIVGTCIVVRWLKTDETHHPGSEGKYESLISFQPTSLDHFANSGFVSFGGQTKFLIFVKFQVARSREGYLDH